MKKTLHQNGFSMIQFLVLAGIIGGLAVWSLDLFTIRQKGLAYVEFQTKRDQIEKAIIGQLLSDKENCGCIFYKSQSFSLEGARDEITPGHKIRELGRYHFPVANDCDKAIIPSPLITTKGKNGLRLESVVLKNIWLNDLTYQGELEVILSSTKEMTGPRQKKINIPVEIQTASAGSGTLKVTGCATKLSAMIEDFDPEYYDVKINRKSSNSKTTSPKTYRYCSLSLVRSGGDRGWKKEPQDRCEARNLGGGIWQISGTRGDDPDIWCGMYCI